MNFFSIFVEKKKLNESVKELHSLTKKRAGNLKIKPVFVSKSKRKAQAEKEKQQKKVQLYIAKRTFYAQLFLKDF